MNKKELRKLAKTKLDALSKEERLRRTEIIHQKLYQTKEWLNAKIIGITVSIGDELDTYKVIQKAWVEKKIVGVPRCLPLKKELVFYEINSFEDLEDSFYGLKEPKEKKEKVILPKNISFLLVPGVVFDQHGYRIGHGGGYYDRFLELYGSEIKATCSLCFHFQLMDNIPKEDHDIPVEKVITDTVIIK
ncbi:5-formyltetrahydrofolate cyclo-ligase [Evansella tamaricis]|uniref:5-formyltetrahydrofolate cyclo-ligase n=1 Tax=Evansella tamaricis TaxID=2069301 RepID=A0ABS6JF21_9BACI|nr:5-formyltetrahydrofolate cyclo-ligase [Evansella tamaricis]MBU9712258.1 5-formyltetrahydrofolate cyclo-ligase [Evansella tamaricis]